MTPIEIAYFKHFMYDRAIARTFQYLYRTRRVKGSPNGDKDGNPELIEQYFLQTSVEDVIMKAFVFQIDNGRIREDQSFNYWKAIDEKWQTYMSQNEDNLINDSWPLLKSTFSVLRQNWDTPQYWFRENFESTKEVYERMNINLPLPEKTWEHGGVPTPRKDAEQLQLNVHNASDGDYLVRIKTSKEGIIYRSIMLFRKLEPLREEPGQLVAKLYAFYCIENKQLRVSDEDHGNIIVNPSDPTVVFRGAFDGEKELLLKKLAEEGLKWDEKDKALVPVSEEQPEQTTQRPLIQFAEDNTDGFDIDFVEFGHHRTVTKLQRGFISVNTRNHSGRITFNRTDTKDVRKKPVGNAMVGKTPAGEVMIMFCNNKNGIPFKYTDDYLTINSTQFCEHLKRLLDVTDDLEYLQIEKVSEKIDSTIYKVTKQ